MIDHRSEFPRYVVFCANIRAYLNSRRKIGMINMKIHDLFLRNPCACVCL